jgi:hypothetical protein
MENYSIYNVGVLRQQSFASDYVEAADSSTR